MPDSTLYIPFARKYRPGSFSELYGQDVLSKVLNFTIINRRISQVYLLTGIRGVGKTTSARIIAKTINCTSQLISEESRQFVSPCNACQNCLNFNDHRHPDIIEIDAASKTSVDDIRSIIESSEYKPLISQYKVFIIDEVHMLSKNAFNALLKIIEEPPAHIVFIFATTEVQKIPLTVISRCQRYDLRRLSADELFDLLTKIALSENLQIESEALRIITRKSEGSARDAITLLDQAASLVDHRTGSITVNMINSMLGLIEMSTVIELTQYMVIKDAVNAIKLINKIYISSHNLEGFIEAICEFIAHLSKLKVVPNYNDPVYESQKHYILPILESASLSQLSILWQIFSNGMIEIKTSYNQLITAEMLIIKAIHSMTLTSIEEMLDFSDRSNNHPRQPRVT